MFFWTRVATLSNGKLHGVACSKRRVKMNLSVNFSTAGSTVSRAATDESELAEIVDAAEADGVRNLEEILEDAFVDDMWAYRTSPAAQCDPKYCQTLAVQSLAKYRHNCGPVLGALGPSPNIVQPRQSLRNSCLTATFLATFSIPYSHYVVYCTRSEAGLVAVALLCSTPNKEQRKTSKDVYSVLERRQRSERA